ncbi:hypothetical protein PAMP_021399 [Pampus punctatissimus]
MRGGGRGSRSGAVCGRTLYAPPESHCADHCAQGVERRSGVTELDEDLDLLDKRVQRNKKRFSLSPHFASLTTLLVGEWVTEAPSLCELKTWIQSPTRPDSKGHF